MSKIKLNSKFARKVINNPHMVSTAIRVVRSNIQTLDEAQLPDNEILLALKTLCLSKPSKEILETFPMSAKFAGDAMELGELLWQDIEANFTKLREAFERDFEGKALVRFKQFPNTFTLGVYLKGVNDHLKAVKNAITN